MTENSKIKCGYVTIAGRPNVGKSTLLNSILQQKVSIVTHKPQTTRDRILAIHNTQESQIVFLDTPGIHRAEGSLGKYMNEAAHNAILEADLCLWIIDAACKHREDGLTPAETAIAERIRKTKIKTVVAINKVDLIRPKHRLLPIIQGVTDLGFVETVVPISAKNNDAVDTLLQEITTRLPENPRLYPEDMLSDKADRFFVSELVREAIMNITHKEVPYKTAVVIDSFKQLRKSCEIFASIHIETKGQKGIIIGKGGEMLKQIRETAQAEAEELLGCPVLLKLHVNVSPEWSTHPAGLKKMGYE
ncbi:MAG: GTPase Era [Deltaproteobacteria bacterium]|nr:GTPase Era [Deltaproteobacteria bacterium]MBN2671065.1 GTPase Era [Deltaproteobacteria bacterium]